MRNLKKFGNSIRMKNCEESEFTALRTFLPIRFVQEGIRDAGGVFIFVGVHRVKDALPNSLGWVAIDRIGAISGMTP
jgi:hypothetical protein